MRTPVIGGVQDGGSIRLPPGAEPGYTQVLTGDGERGRKQTTQYVLREDPTALPTQRRALVASDMKWPLFEGASA